VTPTEKDALDRWAARLREVALYAPVVVESDDACDRLRVAYKYVKDAINLLEDGLPF
jgi:hypothetical protein